MPVISSRRPFLGSIAKGAIQWKWPVFIFWLVACAVGGMGAMLFINKGAATEAPGPSRIVDDLAHIKSLFPYLLTNAQYIGIIESPDVPILDVPGLKDFTMALQKELNDEKPLVQFQANATLWEAGIVSSAMVSKDKKSTLLMWATADEAQSKDGCDFAKKGKAILERLVDKHLPGQISFVGLGGAEASIVGAEAEAEMELLIINCIAVPLALLVMLAFVSSGRLLLIPLLSLSVAMSVSMGIMYVIACIVTIQAICASFMTSLLMALTFDYSFIFLTRFRQELRRAGDTSLGAPEPAVVFKAIESTMETAGFAVVCSNIVITSSFLVIAFFPMNVMYSVGTAGVVVSLSVLVVHFTYIPALIALCPGYFGSCLGGRFSKFDCCAPALDIDNEPLVTGDAENGAGTGAPTCTDGVATESGSKVKGVWSPLARFVTSSWSVLAVAGILLVVFFSSRSIAWMAVPIEHKLQVTPRGTNAYTSFTKTVDGFGAGQVNQFMVTLEPPLGETVFSPDFWGKSQGFIKAAGSVLPHTDLNSMRFVSYATAAAIPWFVAEGCLKMPTVTPITCKPLQYLIDSQVNKDHTATFGYVVPTDNFDPVLKGGREYLKKFRQVADAWSATSGLRITVGSGSAESQDNIEKLMSIFPWVIAVTFIVAALLLGEVFKSIATALCAVAAAFFTSVTTYGLAICIYQDGMLDWLQWDALSGFFGALNWMIVLVAFSFIASFSLGHSIVFLMRVAEAREKGAKNTTAAVQQGFCGSASTVVGSAIAICILLGSGLFSASGYTNCFGFMMGFGVLFDALLMQCLVLPAAITFFGPFESEQMSK